MAALLAFPLLDLPVVALPSTPAASFTAADGTDVRSGANVGVGQGNFMQLIQLTNAFKMYLSVCQRVDT